jgi:hypothetical protein
METLMLLFISDIKKTNTDKNFCKAECSFCKSIIEVRKDMLNKQKSCGCANLGKGWRFQDLTNRVFENLVVIERVQNKKSVVMWKCRCDCGKETNIQGKALLSGHTKSCGCRGVPSDFGWISHLYCNYRIGALRRKIVFDLSREQFQQIIGQNCHYCGSPPSEKSNRKDVITGKFKNPSPINGIDRQDNRKGYIIGNCVPCCTTCNKAKSSSSLDDFKQWITRLIEFNN